MNSEPSEMEKPFEASSFRDAKEAVVFLTAEGKVARPNPYIGGLEGQYWQWNKIARHFISISQPEQALELWSAMYLSFIGLQNRYLNRLHKATALCNIGYALGCLAGHRVTQAKSWVLGIIEEVFTDADGAEDCQSFKNLLTIEGATPARIRQLISTVRVRVLEHSMVPLFPETCVDFVVTPAIDGPSENCSASVESGRTLRSG